MMRSLYAGVSGLKSHQTRMDVIGNNIANVNTTGFKSGRVTFTDTLSQTLTAAASPSGGLGGTNAKQIGLGAGVGAIDTIFTNGSIQATGKNTDLCLSGNGLFVVKNGNQNYYTRNGAFEFDESGNYVLPGSGLLVQGWTAVNGAINTSAAIGNIQIQAGKSMPAAATSTVTYSNNLDAAAPTIVKIVQGADQKTTKGDSVTTDTADVTITLSDGTTTTIAKTTDPTKKCKYTVGESLPVTTIMTAYDTLGNVHSIPVYFTKSNVSSTDGNTWRVSIALDGGNTATIVEADGTTTTVTMDSQELHFDTEGKYVSGSGTPTLTLTNGASATDPATGKGSGKQTIALVLTSLTQYAGTSTVNGKENGNAAGTLASIDIDKSGTITGTYTNGVKQIEAQVAVAQFTNASGLTKTGDSLYQESNNSGKANIKTAADLGVTITPSSLEMSNVDIANELTDMIVTQRGFQTNSKIITVSDEMLEQVINMKR